MKLPPSIKQLLDDSGLPWTIETGSRHYKVIINGRMATILPMSPRSLKMEYGPHRNAVAYIKRAIQRERQ